MDQDEEELTAISLTSPDNMRQATGSRVGIKELMRPVPQMVALRCTCARADEPPGAWQAVPVSMATPPPDTTC